AGGLPRPGPLVLDSEAVYWGNMGDDPMSGSIMKLPKAGGTAQTLAPNQSPFALAIDATDIYWVNRASSGAADGSVMRVPKGGGDLVTLASGLHDPWALAVSGNAVYWTESTQVMTIAT